jgi:hypothetical protein
MGSKVTALEYGVRVATVKLGTFPVRAAAEIEIVV